MVELFRRVAQSPSFSRAITAVILLAGVVVGLETDPGIVAEYGATLHLLNQAIVAIFVAEVVIKMGAEGSRPLRYFRDGWNVFDFAIVVACFLPVSAQFVMALRLARILRVLKLVRALPKLQVLVGALLKSIPSMGYVTLLLGLLFYLYAVTGTFTFGANDPLHFGSLPISMLSLFRVVTLEGWTELMYIQMYGCEAFGYDGKEALCTASNAMPLFGSLYFVSFVLLGTMVILNLFVGVIMSGMEEAQRESDDEQRAEVRPVGESELQAELAALHAQLAGLQEQLGRVQRLVVPEDRAAK